MGSANKQVNNEALWRQRIKDHAGSGQSVAAYCRDRSLVVATFYWWKARLRKSASALVVRKMPGEVPFIDLGSVNPAPALNGSPVPGACVDIRLDLGLGMVLTITRR
jgi:hypothetical protein